MMPRDCGPTFRLKRIETWACKLPYLLLVKAAVHPRQLMLGLPGGHTFITRLICHIIPIELCDLDV